MTAPAAPGDGGGGIVAITDPGAVAAYADRLAGVGADMARAGDGFGAVADAARSAAGTAAGPDDCAGVIAAHARFTAALAARSAALAGDARQRGTRATDIGRRLVRLRDGLAAIDDAAAAAIDHTGHPVPMDRPGGR